MPAVPKPSSAHSDLQRDLCRYLEQRVSPPWITLQEMDLGLRGNNTHWTGSVQRADVLAIRWTAPLRIHIYEIKVSRSDFQSDIKSGKWEGYLEHCHLFFFVTPHGMVQRDEIPEGIGWVEVSKRGKNFPTRLTGALNHDYSPSEDEWFAIVKKQAKYGG